MAQTKIEQGLLKFTEATDYLKIPTGTTAQRPSSPEAGYIRFNTTISKFEIYNGTDWTEPGVNPPTVTSLDYPATKTALDPAGGETLLINGTNFQAGISVDFGGTAATSITINSSTQLSVVAPAKAAGNVILTITNTDTGSVQTTVVYNALPTWTTAAGSLGSVDEGGSISFTVAASEADAGAITYSVTSGSLPTGASLNSSTGAITGTAPDVSADTTYNFTITATDDENQTASRAFSITVNNILPSNSFGTILYEGDGTSGHSINGGKFGAAFYGNGSNSYIDFGDNIFKFDEFSISFWVNVSSFVNNQVIYNHYDEIPNQAAGILFRTNSSGNILVDCWDPPSTYGGNVTSTSTLSANTWYHIGITLTQSQVKIYINGSLDKTGSISGFGYHSTHNFILGAFLKTGGSPSSFFNGKIDQFRMFQKVLDSSEVSTLYAETASTVESLDPLSEDTTDTLQVLGDSSCIATYRFENDETDLSGNYNGTGTAIQYAAGRYGQGADFNGTTSQITTSNITGLDTTTISISCWVYMHEVSTFNHFVSRFGTGGHSTYQFILRNTSAAKWSLATYDGTGSGDSLTSTATASANTWYHVAAVIDGTSKKIYVNGSEVASSTVAFSVNTSSGEGLNIGGRDDFGASNTERMNGVIDQVRVFNKALSASEVTTLYNENSLVASYRFEGNANDDTRNYDGTATNVTYEYGLGFTPDFVWIKGRTSADNNFIFDSTRGDSVTINTNLTAAQYADTGLTSFDTGGFTLGSGAGENRNGDDYVAWCLKANGGTTSSNTDGTITSTVQVNQNAGFSIVQYTGTAATASVGHGLGVKPDFVVIKQTNDASAWVVFSDATGTFSYAYLNTTAAFGAYSPMSWDSSVLNLNGGTDQNGLNDTHIAYFFASKQGFSKIGSYTGTGGNLIVETGFEPAFLMVKRTDAATYDWYILDNKRNPVDYRNTILRANSTDADTTVTNGDIDVKFLSNGFAFDNIPGSSGGFNASGGTYFYMAFAADPDTVVPTKAKSFSTVTYTGTGATQSIDTGFKPSFVWIKLRDVAENHWLTDSVRGVTKGILSNLTNAELTRTNQIQSFDSNGFTLGADALGYTNFNTRTYVAWAWKADDNEPTINTDGTVQTIVSANANAGFSIIKFTTPSPTTTSDSFGHGLSVAPELIITKSITNAAPWYTYHKDLGQQYHVNLNTTDAVLGPFTSMFNPVNSNSFLFRPSSISQTYIAYAFHSVSGYSKIGSYTGNGSTNAITGLGFQPDWILARRTDSTDNWAIIDSAREAYLLANLTDAEATYNWFAFTSDGFTLSTSTLNASGGTYIYAAFKIN